MMIKYIKNWLCSRKCLKELQDYIRVSKNNHTFSINSRILANEYIVLLTNDFLTKIKNDKRMVTIDYRKQIPNTPSGTKSGKVFGLTYYTVPAEIICIIAGKKVDFVLEPSLIERRTGRTTKLIDEARKIDPKNLVILSYNIHHTNSILEQMHSIDGNSSLCNKIKHFKEYIVCGSCRNFLEKTRSFSDFRLLVDHTFFEFAFMNTKSEPKYVLPTYTKSLEEIYNFHINKLILPNIKRDGCS
jgi:hypothetical protein